MNRRDIPRSPRLVMWAAIGGSFALLGVLLARGWEDRAWPTAAGVLLLACVFVCVWAAMQAGTAEREVRRAIDRMAAARREDERRARPASRATA